VAKKETARKVSGTKDRGGRTRERPGRRWEINKLNFALQRFQEVSSTKRVARAMKREKEKRSNKILYRAKNKKGNPQELTDHFEMTLNLSQMGEETVKKATEERGNS